MHKNLQESSKLVIRHSHYEQLDIVKKKKKKVIILRDESFPNFLMTFNYYLCP